MGMRLKKFRILKWGIGIIVALILASMVVFSVLEFRPDDRMYVTIEGNIDNIPAIGDSISIMTWNIGYGGMGKNADDFFEGGIKVFPSDQNTLVNNLENIKAEIQSIDPDITFLQSVDINSDRSYGMNEVEYLKAYDTDSQDESITTESAFAYNFNTFYYPGPVPHLGHVESGITTYSKYHMVNGERISLPTDYGFLNNMFYYKRCILVSRMPINGTDKELVLVNIHLENHETRSGASDQVMIVENFLSEEIKKGNYVVCGGDFNAIFPGMQDKYQSGDDASEREIMEADLFDNMILKTGKNAPTVRSLDKSYTESNLDEMGYYVTDGFVVSKNIEVISCWVENLNFENAAHNPVVAWIRFKH